METEIVAGVVGVWTSFNGAQCVSSVCDLRSVSLSPEHKIWNLKWQLKTFFWFQALKSFFQRFRNFGTKPTCSSTQVRALEGNPLYSLCIILWPNVLMSAITKGLWISMFYNWCTTAKDGKSRMRLNSNARGREMVHDFLGEWGQRAANISWNLLCMHLYLTCNRLVWLLTAGQDAPVTILVCKMHSGFPWHLQQNNGQWKSQHIILVLLSKIILSVIQMNDCLRF